MACAQADKNQEAKKDIHDSGLCHTSAQTINPGATASLKLDWQLTMNCQFQHYSKGFFDQGMTHTALISTYN